MAYSESTNYILLLTKFPHLKLSTNILRSGKRCLGFCNHIERKHVVIDIVGRIEPAARNVLGGSFADALRCRRVGVGKNLQC